MALDLQEYSQELLINPNKAPQIKPIQQKKKAPPKPTVKPLTAQEKQTLVLNIRKLAPEHILGMIDILSDVMKADQSELELDLNALPEQQCRDLDNYVKQKLSLLNT